MAIPRAAHAGRTFRLDSSRLADDKDIDHFPLNEEKVYLHDHSPTTRTMGSCRHGAYQVSVAEVIAALNARRNSYYQPAQPGGRSAECPGM